MIEWRSLQENEKSMKQRIQGKQNTRNTKMKYWRKKKNANNKGKIKEVNK